ncbi:MAG TPA: NADH-quinone oxidoreductase subunit N [Acidimicrobiales bacterium]
MTALLAQAEFSGPTIDWWSLTPLIILAGGGLLLMVVAALVPRGWPRGGYAAFTALVTVAAAVTLFFQWDRVDQDGARGLVGGSLVLDGFGVFLALVICAAVLLATLIADDYLRREGFDGCELYALMLMAATGGTIMAWSNDMVVLFLGLETLSIALYVMAGSHLRRIESQESAMKYFVLGAFSSAFLLYGIALVYGATGTTNFTVMNAFLSANSLNDPGLLLAGFALLLVGLGFKVAAVPFHEWTPDVYQGAPSPVTAFMASAAKAAGFAGLLRVFVVTFGSYRVDWQPVLFALAILTLVVGSVLAVVQTNVKRMLAYSSISHAGFILVGVQVATPRGTEAVLFYLLAYAVMVVGTFGVVTLVGRTGDRDHGLDAYHGLAREHPILAMAFTVLLLSQAGVPLTTGFVAKFGIIAAAADAESYALAVVAMLSAVVAAFLYLRIVFSMYFADSATGDEHEPVRIPLGAGVALVLTVAFTLVVGTVGASAVLDFAHDAVPALAAP